MLRACLRRKRKSVATFACVFSTVAMCVLMLSMQGNVGYRQHPDVVNDYDQGSYDLGEDGIHGVQALVRHTSMLKRAIVNPDLKSAAEKPVKSPTESNPKKSLLPIPVFNYKREDVFPHEGGMRKTEGYVGSDPRGSSKNAGLPDDDDEDDYANIKNLVIEDITSDEDDSDEDYNYDYNYPENHKFKMSKFDMTNFTAFQGEEPAMNQVNYEEQDYHYDDADDSDDVRQNVVQNHHQRSQGHGPQQIGLSVGSQPCESPQGCGGGVNLEPDPASRGREDPHGAQAGSPTVNTKQLKDKQDQHPGLNTSGGYRPMDDSTNNGLPAKPNSPPDKGVKTPIRTLKRVVVVDRRDLSTYIHQSKIETQIPLQDGMDANLLGVLQPATQIQTPQLPWQSGEVRSKQGMPLVVNHIYWSKEVEDLVPTGVTDLDIQHFLHKISSSHVKEMHAPLWNRCGRPKNQYVLLDDGTPLCARYRDPHNKLIQGEILTFHLAHLLGLDNVPLVVLTQVNTSATQWRGHQENIVNAGWEEGRLAAFIQWVDGLEFDRSRVRMPTVILEAYQSGQPLDWQHRSLTNLSADQLAHTLQWGDMILLDYITGHYDRVASMQDGADRESKPSIMQESIRNLRQWQTGKLWLIDNESGLFDSYDLMYRGGTTGSRFVTFHLQMLKTMCIFHQSFVEKLRELAQLEHPAEALVTYTRAQEPLYAKLPHIPEYALFRKYFHTRLKEVVKWIDHCRSR